MEYRIPLIAGNWKMFKTCSEAADSAKQLVDLVSDVENVDIMIAPPFTALSVVSEIIRNTRIDLGAQNLFWEKEGAFTGEVSAPMLISAGCQYVIIGHSERRQYFGETDETVNRKIKAAGTYGLIPILCVGENRNTKRRTKNIFST